MFKKKPRCGVCDVKLQDSEDNELRLETAEGPSSMIVCDKCANLFDKVSDFLQRKHKRDDATV